jgi:hypothetical protein
VIISRKAGCVLRMTTFWLSKAKYLEMAVVIAIPEQ